MDWSREQKSRYYYREEDNNKRKKLREPEIIDIRTEKNIFISKSNGVEARVKFFPAYLEEKEANDLFIYLKENLKWEQREGINKNGTYLEPRQTFWLGKPYKYSSVSWTENQVWDEKLKELRDRLSNYCGTKEGEEFNSVMCNYYRDNRDSIGWHADDETSLGRYPKIASISLGCQRVFEVCKRKEFYSKIEEDYNNPIFKGCSILYRYHLNPGSLLIMEGSIQEDWLHRVPKESKEMDGRINLTYRYIVDETAENAEKERRKELTEKRKQKMNKQSVQEKEYLRDYKQFKQKYC